MDSKTRALLWEELRIGGIIAACITAVALLGLAGFGIQARDIDAVLRWHFAGESATTLVIGSPLIMALLLALNRTSSEHLTRGFSRRVLRLPVSTRRAVLLTLTTRLALVLGATSALMFLCQVILHGNPGLRAIVLIADIYLFIQIIDWLMAPAALLAWTLLSALAGTYLLFMGGLFPRSVAIVGDATAPILAASILWTLLVYAASLLAVKYTRCGERIAWLSLPAWERAPDRSAAKPLAPFRSSFTAQIWFELRGHGFIMPTFFAIVYLQLLVALWFISRTVDTFWAFEVLPFVALFLSAFAWSLKTEWATRPRARLTTFAHRLPMTRVEVVRAGYAAAGINLAAMLLPTAIISTLLFLCRRTGRYDDISELARRVGRELSEVHSLGACAAGRAAQALGIGNAFDGDGPVFAVFAEDVEGVVGLDQDLRFAVAPEPPAVLPAAGGLYAQKRVAAVEDVALHEGEIGVVFVDVVFFVSLRKSADDVEMAVVVRDSARAVDGFRDGVFGEQGEIVCGVDVDP